MDRRLSDEICKAVRAEARTRKKPFAGEGSAEVEHQSDPLGNSGAWMVPQVAILRWKGWLLCPESVCHWLAVTCP